MSKKESLCEVCGCNSRKSNHSDKVKKDMINRLNRIEGQIKGIKKMIENDIYCDDILNQITSSRSALNSVSTILLENHIRSCVVDQLNEGKMEVIDELVKTISRMSK